MEVWILTSSLWLKRHSLKWKGNKYLRIKN
jgi:hypothetical protein